MLSQISQRVLNVSLPVYQALSTAVLSSPIFEFIVTYLSKVTWQCIAHDTIMPQNERIHE